MTVLVCDGVQGAAVLDKAPDNRVKILKARLVGRAALVQALDVRQAPDVARGVGNHRRDGVPKVAQDQKVALVDICQRHDKARLKRARAHDRQHRLVQARQRQKAVFICVGRDLRKPRRMESGGICAVRRLDKRAIKPQVGNQSHGRVGSVFLLFGGQEGRHTRGAQSVGRRGRQDLRLKALVDIKRHARGPQLAHQVRQAKGQGLPGNQGLVGDLEVLGRGQRSLRAGVHVADEKSLLEGGRLCRKLFPRGQDKARSAEDLQVVAAHRPHAHKPGVKLCRVSDKARFLKRAGHRCAGVVQGKAVGREIHHNVCLDLVIDEVVNVLVGKGDGDLLALEVDNGHLA